MSTKRGGGPVPRRLPIPLPILVLLVLVVAAAGFSLLAPDAGATEHPTPRPGITAAEVVPAERYAADPRVAQVYREITRIASVADGLYCHCDCSKHSGHRSLLSCFESDHGAGCDICLGEAHLAFTMTQQGATLEQIRTAIDRQFGA